VFVAVHPEAELEVDAVGGALIGDVAEGFEVARGFGIGEIAGADFVPWYIGKKEGVREEEVGVGDFAEEIVADAEGEMEAVEAVRGEHGEVLGPHLAVVEPGLVLELAAEEAHVAAHGEEGQFGLRLRPIGAVADAVGHFEDGELEAGGVAAVEVEGRDVETGGFDAVGAGSGDDRQLGWFGWTGGGQRPGATRPYGDLGGHGRPGGADYDA